MNAGGLRRRTVAALLSLSIASAHLVGFAQTDEERAAARSAANEGAKAFGDKRWGDAIDLFQKAESLVHAPPHLLYLARSYEKLGKLVKAQEMYIKLTHETIAPDKPKVFHDAKDSAIKELAALEPRVPTLKTTVEGGTAGKPIKVLVDGVEMNSALLGLNRPVDPGEHKLEATSDGLASEPTTITVKEGAHESITLTLKPASAIVTTPKPVGDTVSTDTTTTTGDASTTTIPETPASESSGKTPWLGIGLLGVGVVGLGLGTVFLLSAKSKSNDADSLCGGSSPCNVDAPTRAQIEDLDSQSKSAKTLGIVSMTIGGLAAVGGIVVILTNKSSSTPSTTASLKPSVTPWVGVGSVGLSGSF